MSESSRSNKRAFPIGALLGILLLVGAITAFVLIFYVFAPPKVPVLTAIDMLPAGSVLSPEKLQLVDVTAGREHLQYYLTADNYGQYHGATLIDTIYPGEFVPITSVSTDNTPAAYFRTSLALGDTGLVAMAIPVTVETSPQKIVPGDHVDITLSVGTASFLAGAFGSVPTPEGVNSLYVSSGVGLANPQAGPTLETPFEAPEPTPTAEPPISLPVTKTIVTRARVIEVVYQLIINPSFAPGSDAPQTVNGDIRVLIVAVPRDAQEAIAFGIRQEGINITVLDPLVAEENYITPGMSWDDLVAYYYFLREEWLAGRLSPDIYYPAGARELVGTIEATRAAADAPATTQIPATSTPEAADATPTPTP